MTEKEPKSNCSGRQQHGLNLRQQLIRWRLKTGQTLFGISEWAFMGMGIQFNI